MIFDHVRNSYEILKYLIFSSVSSRDNMMTDNFFYDFLAGANRRSECPSRVSVDVGP
jgi:hypothetical protein